MKFIKPKTSQFLISITFLFSLFASLNTYATWRPDDSPTYVSVPAIDWTPCFQERGPFECGVMEVPLRHSRWAKYFYLNQNQDSIGIAVIRVPARDPANKIGSLFLNPGGPGGSGVGFALNAGLSLYTQEVRDRFDIVGFDPRGTNASAPLSCFTSLEHIDEVNALPFFPKTIEEEFAQLGFNKKFQKNCRKNASAILDNMSTADVARDMDILRQAVGDDQLNFLGVSYGSFLGVSYANLYPERVRAVIVDAVLDPISWTTGRRSDRHFPVGWRLRSDAGAMATLNEFFRLCDLAGFPRCIYAGDAETRYAALVETLATNPVILPQPDGSELVIDDTFLITLTLSRLYNSGNWAATAQLFAFLEAQAAAGVTEDSFSTFEQLRRRGDGNPDLVQQTIEASPGVLCSDSDNPHNPFVWPFAAEIAERDYGYFGRRWTWVGSVCSRWPGSQRSNYQGPFTKHTANPVLVTSTLYDPATRYEGAQTVADLLPNSHLLTIEGWGHATIFLSQCATQINSDYLINGELPGTESTCRQDFPPFNLSPPEVFPESAPAPTQRSQIQSLTEESADTDRETMEENRAKALRSIIGSDRRL